VAKKLCKQCHIVRTACNVFTIYTTKIAQNFVEEEKVRSVDDISVTDVAIVLASVFASDSSSLLLGSHTSTV